MYLAPMRAFSTYIILMLVVLTLLGTYQPVQAVASLEVETTADEFTDGSWLKGCSLREAIYSVYINDSYGGCQGDSSTNTITLPAGEYLLTIPGANEDDGKTGDLDVRESITIIGAGAGVTKIIGGEAFGDRIFHILGGAGSPTVRISNLTISGGWAPTGGGSGVRNQGATLYLDNVVVTGNGHLNSVGGGVSNAGGSALFITNATISGNSGSYGGGIYNAGTVTITDSTVTDNTANRDGGGLASNPLDANANLTQITRSIFSLNHVNDPIYGAGISSNGRLTIEDSTVESNAGIGLLTSGLNVTITNSQFRGNVLSSAVYGAGIDCSGALSITGSQIEANTGTGMVVKSGVATAAVTITKTNIAQNSGLGLRVDTSARATITESSIVENASGGSSAGAGIASAGILTLNYSTVAKNAGPGLLVSGGTTSLTNSTVGANGIQDDLANSIGIISTGGALSLKSVTIADQTGGGLRVNGGTASATGTLFARNGTANCTKSETATFTSQGHNLLDFADAAPIPCAFGGPNDLVANANPGLDDQLRNNGGFTQTYALSDPAIDPNSIAVDAMDKTMPACLAADQRVFGRPVDGNYDGDRDCDIGAYEFGAVGYSMYLPVIRR